MTIPYTTLPFSLSTAILKGVEDNAVSPDTSSEVYFI